MFAGSTVSKIVAFCAYPIIARIYSPEEFGVLSVFTSTVFVLLPITTLRIPEALPICGKGNESSDIVKFSIIWITTCSIIIYLLLAFYGERIFDFLNTPTLIPITELLVITLFFAAIFELLMNFSISMERFTDISIAEVVRTTVSVSVQFVLGLMGCLSLGLIYGELVHKIFGSAYLIIRNIHQPIKLDIGKSRFRRMLSEHRQFPLYKVPSDLSTVIVAKLPIFFYSSQFSAELAGQLALAFSTFAVPMRLVSKNVAKVYFSEIAKLTREGISIISFTRNLFFKILIVSILGFILLQNSPLIFRMVFGAKWSMSGKFLQLISLSLILEFIIVPFLSVYVIKNKQKTVLMYNVLRLVVVTMGFYFCHRFAYSPITSMWVYNILTSVILSIQGVVLYRTVHKE